MTRPTCDLVEGAKAVQLANLAYRSAAEQRWMTVPDLGSGPSRDHRELDLYGTSGAAHARAGGRHVLVRFAISWLALLVAAPRPVSPPSSVAPTTPHSTTIASSSPRTTASPSRSCWPATVPRHRSGDRGMTAAQARSAGQAAAAAGAHLHLRQALAGAAARLLVLVFDPALNLGHIRVLRAIAFPSPARGRFYVYAIYCWNDWAMSQTTVWTDATARLTRWQSAQFRELHPVVFSGVQNRWAFNIRCSRRGSAPYIRTGGLVAVNRDPACGPTRKMILTKRPAWTDHQRLAGS